MRLWIIGSVCLVLWFVLTFILGKAGFVHILLLTAISLYVVQFTAHRKTKYHQKSSK